MLPNCYRTPTPTSETTLNKSSISLLVIGFQKLVPNTLDIIILVWYNSNVG